MSQLSNFDLSGVGFKDLFKYGTIRAIDSEFGNPPVPSPYAPNRQQQSDIYQSTPTGTGTVTKRAGTLSAMEKMSNQPLLIAAGVFFGAFLIYKMV